MKINTVNDKTYVVGKPIKESPRYGSKVLITKGFYRGFSGKVISKGESHFIFFNPDSYQIKFRLPDKLWSMKKYFDINDFEIIEL